MGFGESTRAWRPDPGAWAGTQRCRRLLAAGDALAVMLALTVALVIPGLPAGGHRILWGVVAVPLMMVLFKLYGLYDRDVKRITYSTVDDLPRLFHATVIGGLILWVYARYSPMRRLDFAEILLFGVNVIVLVTVTRFAIRSIAGRVIGDENALLVGTGQMGQTLVGKLAAHPEYRLNVIGSLSPTGASSASENRHVPALGTLEQLEQVADRHDVTRVVFSARDIEESELERMLRDCRALALKVSVLPRLADVLGPAVEVDDVEGVTVLGVNPPWLPRSSRVIKRAMDLLIAVPLLILAAPLLGLLAASHQARFAWPGALRPGAGRPGRPSFPPLQAAHDGRRRRAAPRGADRPEHRAGLAETRPRSADHSHWSLAAATEPGRASSALERRARRDEPGRARAPDPG